VKSYSRLSFTEIIPELGATLALIFRTNEKLLYI